MTEKTSLPEIGPRLQAIRKRRGLTLEQLAGRSGVSRSMLSQIERGIANPTFATLWSLTQALGLDLSELAGGIEEVHHQVIEVMQSNFTPEIRSEDGLCLLRILSPGDQVGKMEWYEILMEPGAVLASDGHARGSVEHLTALDGTFVVTSGGATSKVEIGATGRYSADVTHTIRNDSAKKIRGLLVVAN